MEGWSVCGWGSTQLLDVSAPVALLKLAVQKCDYLQYMNNVPVPFLPVFEHVSVTCASC